MSLSLVVPLAAATDDDNLRTEGHILVGHPGTVLVGGVSEHGLADEGVDGFSVSLNPTDLILETEVEDSTSPRHDIDAWFYDADGLMDDQPCATTAYDENCQIPAGATTAWVDARRGVDLDVLVFVTGPAS